MEFIGTLFILAVIFFVFRYAINTLSDINDSIEPKESDHDEWRKRTKL